MLQGAAKLFRSFVLQGILRQAQVGQQLVTLEGRGKTFTGKQRELTVLQSAGRKHTDGM